MTLSLYINKYLFIYKRVSRSHGIGQLSGVSFCQIILLERYLTLHKEFAILTSILLQKHRTPTKRILYSTIYIVIRSNQT